MLIRNSHFSTPSSKTIQSRSLSQISSRFGEIENKLAWGKRQRYGEWELIIEINQIEREGLLAIPKDNRSKELQPNDINYIYLF